MAEGAQQLEVALGERSYPIHVGAGLLADHRLIDGLLAGEQVMVVSNETVAPLYLDTLRQALDRPHVDVCILPDGEQHKTLATYARVIDELMARRHNRTTTVIALGGGVVGDISGFVAATYQRGVGFVQVPTTLLAQVDSSVGGKTAVNHPDGKNMIGAFYQPGGVIIDTDVLNTLPDREFLAGVAEVIKYGVISDAGFFAWLEEHIDALLARDADTLTHAIVTSCAIKAEVVAADEREAGLRAILNFGHTFGHAFEAVTDYRLVLHGEAVAVGMVQAADLSVRSGRLDARLGRRIRALIQRAGLPVRLPDGIAADALLDAMGMDKKVVHGRLRLVLALDLGEVDVTEEVDPALVRQTLEAGDALCDG